MMVRTSKEFNFRINAFHHALEAWKIPEMLAAHNITAATFADHWGFKARTHYTHRTQHATHTARAGDTRGLIREWNAQMEGYDGSVHGPRVLHEAGVNVVLKSDHPVIFGRWLMYEAARAHYYGLDAWTAIASVTRVPQPRPRPRPPPPAPSRPRPPHLLSVGVCR
jgi:imidazolonepropionase-like amidohydrolase